MADSLKLAVVCCVGCLVSWSGALALFDSPWFETAAFLAFFTWPLAGLILFLYVCVCAAREIKLGRRRQAVVAIVLAGFAAVFGLMFTGWE